MSAPAWRDALDDGLVRRLRRPVDRPGVTDPGQARRILARARGMTAGLPLLDTLGPRTEGLPDGSAPPLPIVFAETRTAEPIIQRKLDPTATPPTPPLPTVFPQLLTAPPPPSGPALVAETVAGLPVVAGVSAAEASGPPRPEPGLPLVPAPTPAAARGAEPATGVPVVPGSTPAAAGADQRSDVGATRERSTAHSALSSLTGNGWPATNSGQRTASAPTEVRSVVELAPEAATARPPTLNLPLVVPTAAQAGPAAPALRSLTGNGWPATNPGQRTGGSPVVVRALAGERRDGHTGSTALPLVRERVVIQRGRADSRLPLAAGRPSPMPTPQPQGPGGMPRPSAPAMPQPAAGGRAERQPRVVNAPVDVDRIAATVHRRFLRQLVVESERRGVR